MDTAKARFDKPTPALYFMWLEVCALSRPSWSSVDQASEPPQLVGIELDSIPSCAAATEWLLNFQSLITAKSGGPGII